MSVEHLVTQGTFSLDGETFDVDNNVFLIGDEREVIVVDAPHDVEAILEAVGGRRVQAIVCTHAHDDHVRYATQLADRTGAPIWLHPADEPLWQLTHPERRWDHDLADGVEFGVGPLTLSVIHTPGHSPGSVSLYSPSLGCVFTGDTLFHGGPGATGRSFSSRPLIEESIRTRLFALPDETVVRPGHGPDTTIGAEAAALGR